MLKRIARRARDVLDQVIDDRRGTEVDTRPWEDSSVVHQVAKPFPEDPRSHEERQFVEQFASEPEIKRLRRRCDEYFKVIESIEKQRDEWIDMYQTHTREHLNAQLLLERKIVALRQLVGRLIHHINGLRKKLDMDELKVQGIDDLEPYDGEPVGTAERYAKRMVDLAQQMPALINGAIRRESAFVATGGRIGSCDEDDLSAPEQSPEMAAEQSDG